MKGGLEEKKMAVEKGRDESLVQQRKEEDEVNQEAYIGCPSAKPPPKSTASIPVVDPSASSPKDPSRPS